MSDVKTCSRPGCGKKLNANNTKGVCNSGCRSAEAPPSMRAPTATPSTRRPVKRAAAGEALERFRAVAEALGMDPDAVLEEFAEAWLAELREKVAA